MKMNISNTARKCYLRKNWKNYLSKKIIIYSNEVKKRMETEKFFIEDSKFILLKKLWSYFEKKISSYTREKN
jgi:hypothetical protein